MIAHVLQEMIEQERATVDELAEASSVSRQTIYNWREGKGEPTESSIRGMINRFHESSDGRLLLDEITGGKAVFKCSDYDQELDFNKDGKVDMGDALAASIQSCKTAQETLTSIHENYMSDPSSISLDLLSILHANIKNSRRLLGMTDCICTREVSKRHKARS